MQVNVNLGVFERLACEPDIAGTVFDQKDFDRCRIHPNLFHNSLSSFGSAK